MVLPEKVKIILRTLNEADHEAYAVGGCVRDALLGREAGDWDITTSASPVQVKGLFPRTIDTGIAHGTVTVMVEREGFEVTTYRVDGAYKDGRHPESVSFTSSLEEDLKRRDFTINAMAYHPDTGIVDIFGGQGDLERKVICCVGDAKERFTEDALRMMRALRFRAQLNFTMEENTRAAIRVLAPRLELVSRERIQVELVKLLLSDHPECMLDLEPLGMEPYVLPEWGNLTREQKEKAVEAAGQLSKEKYLRLAALFCIDCASENWGSLDQECAVCVRTALRGLRLDNETTDRAQILAAYHRIRLQPDPRLLRRMMSSMKPELFFDLLSLQKAWAHCVKDSQYALLLDQVRQCSLEILEAGDCLDLKHLAVNGRDLAQEGIAQGKEIGTALAAMLEEVLNEPSHNDRDWLLTEFRKEKKSISCRHAAGLEEN